MLHKAILADPAAPSVAAAQTVLRRSMALAPSSAAARNLALAALAQKDFPDALMQAKTAGDGAVSSWIAGQTYAAMGDEANALAAWAAADATQYFLAEGQRSFRPCDLERGIQAFNRALGLAPDSVAALIGMGELHVRCGRPEPALYYLRAALQHDPDLDAAYYMIGRTLLAQGDAQGALDHFLRAEQLAPENWAYAEALADIYALNGDSVEAARWREQSDRLLND